jgi:hypothetical protein
LVHCDVRLPTTLAKRVVVGGHGVRHFRTAIRTKIKPIGQISRFKYVSAREAMMPVTQMTNIFFFEGSGRNSVRRCSKYKRLSLWGQSSEHGHNQGRHMR